MKIMLTALTTLVLGTATAYAAGPAKTATVDGAKIYTDASGMSLYTYDKDAKDKSSCDGDCAVKWPPFKAAAGATAEGGWTLVKRTDGSMMWAFDGKPLYTYQGDKKAGEATGNGMAGGTWHLAKAK